MKKNRLQAMKINEMANAIMEKKKSDIDNLQFQNLTLSDLDTLLRWHNSLTGMKSKATKNDKVAKLKEIFRLGRAPPTFEEWTADDERKLEKLQDLDNIAMADTAVGREREMMKQGLMSAGVNLSEEEWVKLTELRKRKWGESEL